jgi:endonuclease III
MPSKKRAVVLPQTTRAKVAGVTAKKIAPKAAATPAKQPVPSAGAKGAALLAKSKPTATVKAKAKAKAKGGKAVKAAPGPALLPPVRMPSATISEVFRRFHAAEPEPKGELEYINPFTLLVAVVLSAQATDAGVNKATRALFAAAPTPAAMVALGEESVRDHIKTIGLFRNKAKNVMALSAQLIANHDGEVPRERDALVALPGVGRKTANVVLNMAFGMATMAVDTHVFRVANRTGMAPGKDVEVVEQLLLDVVPEAYGLHAHHWLILHGRYTCLARKPLCGTCPIKDLCLFDDKTA